jgi:hypothetical protein
MASSAAPSMLHMRLQYLMPILMPRADTYYEGDVIELHVVITAYHKGRFAFRICNSTGSTSDACFKQTVLTR